MPTNSYFYLYFEPWSESEILRVLYSPSYGMGLTLTSYLQWSKAVIIISLVETYCCFALWLLLCDIKVLDACDYVENGTLLTSPRCKNNGNCVNGTRSDSPGSFGCDCAIGYRGQFCQEGLLGHLALVIIYSTYVCLWHQLIYSDKITYPGFLCAYVNWYSRQLCIGHWYADIMYPHGYEALDNDNSWSETPVKSPMWDFAACSDDLYTRLWKITYVPT